MIMTSRMGGELEISSNLLSSKPQSGIVLDFPKPYHLKLNTGRAALYTILKEILRRGGRKKCWIPAFICPSVVTVFKALSFEVEYYACGNSLLEPELFDDKIGEGETLLYAHYFGKKNTPITNWINSWEKSKSVFIIEDCVQSSLNKNIGVTGNFSFTSYRKFLPQPDGAYLFSDFPIEIGLAPSDETFISSRFLGKLLRTFSDQDSLYLNLFSQSEEIIDHDLTPREISWISTYLMNRVDIPEIAKRRQHNWKALLKLIQQSPRASHVLSPLFPGLDEEEIPLGFPVKVFDGKRDSLRRFLSSQKIYCPVHWSLAHLNDVPVWNREKNLSQSILTIPIDQRLDENHMKTIVKAIESFTEG